MDFPEIPDDAMHQLAMVSAMVAEDPSCLDREECPYPEYFKSILRPSSEAEAANLDLESEIKGLMQKLEEFGSSLSSEDTKELNTFFRLKTTLLEKLTTLQERSSNITKITEFKTAVLQILDDEMDKDQRARILERLRGLT